MPAASARFWIGTIFVANETRASKEWFESLLGKHSIVFLSGQLERCGTTGRLHYQILVGFSKPQRRRALNTHVGNGHWEPTRSEAARAYCHKVNFFNFRTIQPSPTPASSLEPTPFVETMPLTGSSSETVPNPENWMLYHRTFTFAIIAHCALSLQTIADRLLWNDKYMSSGAELALEKVAGLGMRPVYRLTVKIPAVSGGVVTRTKLTLLSVFLF